MRQGMNLIPEHLATIEWKRESASFDCPSYNRGHLWHFESGISVRASAAPRFLGTPDCVDPEESYVAAISSCHMLMVKGFAET